MHEKHDSDLRWKGGRRTDGAENRRDFDDIDSEIRYCIDEALAAMETEEEKGRRWSESIAELFGDSGSRAESGPVRSPTREFDLPRDESRFPPALALGLLTAVFLAISLLAASVLF